eukprot:104649_1
MGALYSKAVNICIADDYGDFNVKVYLYYDTIKSVKHKIYEENGIPPERQALFLANDGKELGRRELEDMRRLSQYDIKDSDTIRVLEKWKCHVCTFINHPHKIQSQCEMCDTQSISIPIKEYHTLNRVKFSVPVSYVPSMRIQTIMQKICERINKRAINAPKVYYIDQISEKSFLGIQLSEYKKEQWNAICSTPITKYKISDILNKGLEICVLVRCTHKITANKITCKAIVDSTDEKGTDVIDVLKCPIYKSMKIDYELTKHNLKHISEFVHFNDEYNEKHKCRYGLGCKAFIRLENGGNRLDDRCHVKLFRHPPRSRRQLQNTENMNSFVFNSKKQENESLYEPTNDDKKQYEYNSKDGFVNALIEEVVGNGFKSDLCLECQYNDDCKHNSYTLLFVVDEKLSHIRHKQMGNPLRKDHMLAMLLYTGCECNYDLCSSQRSGNYQKWKWFDYCLFNAIKEIRFKETGCYKLYSGLNKVKLNKKEVLMGYFQTYTSTSWIRDVAVSFMEDEGMIIEIDEKIRNWFVCCDVSWISKFCDESEILIARSHQHGNNNFSLSILDEQNGMQTVSLTQFRR